DERNVKIAVVPPDDAGAVFLAKIDLPLIDHSRSPRPWQPSDISHIYHMPTPRSIRRLRQPCTLDHPRHGRVPTRLSGFAGKNNLSAFNDIKPVGETRHVVNIRLGDEDGTAE